MNNTLNIHRFGLLIKRQWLDFGKIYLISLIVLLGVIALFYGFNIPKPERYYSEDGISRAMNFRYPLFLITGFLFISIVASTYFSNLGQKSRAILELLTPASMFEKFLCGFFYTAILSVLTYLVIFLLTDFAFIKYLNSSIELLRSADAKAMGVRNAQTILEETHHQIMENARPGKNLIMSFLMTPFLVTSVFLLGSIYFNRFHYIKTAISVMVFSGVATYLIVKSAQFLTRNMTMSNQTRHRDEDLALTIVFLTITAITLIFWAITYIRLKEKEV